MISFYHSLFKKYLRAPRSYEKGKDILSLWPHYPRTFRHFLKPMELIENDSKPQLIFENIPQNQWRYRYNDLLPFLPTSTFAYSLHNTTQTHTCTAQDDRCGASIDLGGRDLNFMTESAARITLNLRMDGITLPHSSTSLTERFQIKLGLTFVWHWMAYLRLTTTCWAHINFFHNGLEPARCKKKIHAKWIKEGLSHYLKYLSSLDAKTKVSDKV